MRPTMNLVVTLHITQTNPLQTKMSKEGSSHQKQITQLHNHNSHHPRKAARRTPSSTDQQSTEKRVHRAILQGLQVTSYKDQPLQHPQHKLEDHHRLPQSLDQVQTTRIHWNAITPMDPPKHLHRAKVLPNQRRHQNLILKIRQIQILLLSLLTLLYVLDVAKVATGAKTVHIIIFVIFVG